MNSKILVILESAMGDGTTKVVIDEIFKNKNVQFVDLLQKNISRFNYDYKNPGDDFLALFLLMLYSIKKKFFNE